MIDELFSDPYEIDEKYLNIGLSRRQNELLRVPTVCAIHGDLHFNNILVDAYFPEDPLFVLVDPRHNITTGDPAFDIAKLLLSCHGYDFIDTRKFDLNIVPNHRLPGPTIHMKIPDLDVVYPDIEPGAVASGLINKELTLPQATPNLFKAAVDAVSQGARSLEKELTDSGIWTRAGYYEAILCLTLSEVHIVENPKGALALTLRGLKMLYDWRRTNPS